MSETEEEHSPVLGIVVAILIGLLVRSISSLIPQKWRIIPLPYTALILLLGGAVGKLVQSTPDVAYVSDSLRTLESIAPSVLYTVFLPALILPSGFSLNWHVVKKVLDKALLLAIPGTLFNATLIALVARYVLPYNWPWSGSWLLGATLAATDPVAVVAIMHSVGASIKLSTIIEGESLLNDGVAFVLFELFRRWAEGENLTAGGVVGFVFKASLGGPALGVAWALGLILWLSVVFNDAIVEVTLSLVAGYSLWVVSDEVLGLSGMLALVFFATMFGAFGKSRISRSVAPIFDSFWSWVDWLANTLIFFLSGLIIALELSKFTTITSSDWGWAFLLFLFLIIIRAASVVLLYPLLRIGHYGIDWKDAVVLTWAGLRGAVGLTLALIVYSSPNLLDAEYRERFFFFLSFAAFFTLFIQGSTTSILLRLLGYMKLPDAKKNTMLRAAAAVERLGEFKVEKAKKVPTLLGDADWDQVKQLVELQLSKHIRKRHIGGNVARKMSKLETAQRPSRLVKEGHDLRADLRHRLLHEVLALYLEAFSSEFLTPDETLTLRESVEIALDEVEDGLTDWEILNKKLIQVELLDRKSGIADRLMPWRNKETRVGRDAAMCAAFACAHAEARRELVAFLEIEFNVRDIEAGHDASHPKPSKNTAGGSTDDNNGTAAAAADIVGIPNRGDSLRPYWQEEHSRCERQALADAAEELQAPLPSELTLERMSTTANLTRAQMTEQLAGVLEESRNEQALAEAHLAALRDKCPSGVAALRTVQVAVEILKQQREFLERLQGAGLLDEAEVDPALNKIERRLQTLMLEDFKNILYRPSTKSLNL